MKINLLEFSVYEFSFQVECRLQSLTKKLKYNNMLCRIKKNNQHTAHSQPSHKTKTEYVKLTNKHQML